MVRSSEWTRPAEQVIGWDIYLGDRLIDMYAMVHNVFINKYIHKFPGRTQVSSD